MRTAILFLALSTLLAADPRPQVDIVTNMGTIRCTLFADAAPETVANFLALAEGSKPWTDPTTGAAMTKPFFDGLVFHRVIADFMIQGGCPLGQGSSGPGYAFKDEINATSLGLDTEMALTGEQLHPQCGYMGQQFFQYLLRPRLEAKGITEGTPPQQQQAAIMAELPLLQKVSLRQFYEAIGYVYDDTLPPSHRPVKGCLAMANSGPNTNGSQFFINLADTPHLTGKHTVFGEVTGGADIVAAIGATKTGPGDRPLEPITIISIRRVASEP